MAAGWTNRKHPAQAPGVVTQKSMQQAHTKGKSGFPGDKGSVALEQPWGLVLDGMDFWNLPLNEKYSSCF